ncbi:site-specific DNA-methyltransferase [Corynebacterium variabile]|uniref:site-specific DNA-methyltransferase n=1 Tax=Corynebacterium variabile TaxID=1727 RepID=UPI003FD3CD91
MNNDFSNADSLSLSSENDEVDGLHRTEQGSPNFRTELAAQLSELVPEAIADGQVDVEKLRELLDGDVADTSERFGLFWPGKKQAQRMAQEPTTATLRPDKENSKDWDTTKNVFIEGDNLEVLKILQKHYHNKIKMIYIDPPYNTGKDFVYKDNFRDGIDTYLEWTQQINEEGKKLSTNSDSEGRYHSNWLNMMYPRLKLARNLLGEDGAILISIGDDELHNLRQVANEIFGEFNFVGVFSRTSAEGGGLAKQMIKGHDYVVVYARSIKYFPPLLRPKEIRGKVVNIDGEEFWIEEDWLRKEFGKYGTCHYEEILKYHPRSKLDEIDKGLANGRYVLVEKRGKNIVGRYRKVSEDGSKFHSVIKHLNANGVRDLSKLQGMDAYFDFPKPVSLVRDLVRGATFGSKNSEDIILDFFAGSSTTAQAVFELNSQDGGNRRVIEVQLPEPLPTSSQAYRDNFRNICDISRERIKRSGESIFRSSDFTTSGTIITADCGFRSYVLSKTNFSKWRQSSDVELSRLEQKMLEIRNGSSADEATADDLLVEILLKQGYSLTETINADEVAGLDVRLVLDALGNTEVLSYLDERTKPTLDQLRDFVDEKPGRIIILEDAFQGDDELKTNLAQLCKSRDIELWTA